MKKGINQWSFPASTSVSDCLRLAEKAGFEGLELCLEEKGEFSLDTSPEYVSKLAQAARDIGIEVPSVATGLYWKYSPTSSDQAVRAKALEIAKRQIEFASILGADTILYVPGAVNVPWDPSSEIVEYDVAYSRAKDMLLALTETADQYGINIGVENVWNKFLLSPLEMCQFIDEIGHPRVQAYFDVGNVLVSGYPEHWIKILKNRIKKVHVKDFKVEIGNITGFTNLLQGDVNWPGVVAALQDVGYDGYLTAEILPPYRYYPEKLIYDVSSSLDEILGRARK
ncbi:MAG TPA: sugar phosphate isomerase/epimerase [Firmicutes bacterium]|nr:sugar phosphate isomerase/epimerase [Bacillota bacterium]HHY98598.1 sugar phosphate isomerase/epimerase [Bacillota bacterium]